MNTENPQVQKAANAESEDAMKGKPPEEFDSPQREPVEKMIATDTEELEALWSHIPEDVKQSSDFFDLTEGYKGDVEAYVASQREWYKKQGIDQYWGDFQLKEKLRRLHERVIATLGEDESKKVVAEAQVRQREERRQRADAATAEKLQAIKKDLGIETDKDPENLFDRIKREYGVADVRSIQQAFVAFEEYRKKEKGQFVVGDNQFYQFLTSGELSDDIESPAAKAMEAEKDADPKDYQDLILGFYGSWCENMNANKERVLAKRPGLAKTFELMETLPTPQTSDELRDLYRKYPALNEISAVSYQDGLGEQGMRNNPFLHFYSHRKNGYAYESAKTEVRLYLNPPKEILPQIAKQFAELAEREKVPYYFKMIDFSLQKPTKSDARRLDRMVFYSDKENGPKIAELLQKISNENPEWLKGRPLPPLVAEAADGVGAAEEPSDYQNQKFSSSGEKSTSFNAVRAKFLRDVWQDTARDVLTHNPDIRPRGGRTLQEIFNDLVPPADKQYAGQFQSVDFDESKLDARGKDIFKTAMLRFMADVLPNIQSESLMPYVNEEIKNKAKEYGVDPKNLAFNL